MRGGGEKWGSESETKERCYVGIKAEMSDIWKGERETEKGREHGGRKQRREKERWSESFI